MKRLKARIVILFIAVFSIFIFSVSVSAAEYLEKLRITSVGVIDLNIDGEYTFLQDYVSSDETIFKIEDKVGKAMKEGTVYLTLQNKKEKQYIVNIKSYYDYISISGSLMIDKGETTQLSATVYPKVLNQDVNWSSTDESIATVDSNGLVTAKEYGITTIIATSKNDSKCIGKTIILVDDDSLEQYEDIIEIIPGETKVEHIDATNLESVFLSLISKVSQSVVGVEKYAYKRSFYGTNLESVDFGSGVVYRRDAILKDNTVINNADDLSNDENFLKYRYYVISSRTIAKNADELKIYLGDENEITANLIQYDDKIDLSVLTFETDKYIPTATFGDSDDIERGEFIIAIGNGYGKEYFRSATFGVISYTKRYAATDTDGDKVNDWDSEYIQHDASINSKSDSSTSGVTSSSTNDSGGNGGALVNLKGEIIGINSTTISSVQVDNMSFATPAKLVQEIVSILETGNKLTRPLLGVEIIDVKAFYQNPAGYLAKYPLMQTIPDGNLTYGFYVNVVNSGGVAEMAGCQVSDVILEFNGVKVEYSYVLRAELGKFIIGSGQTTTLKVWRNGEVVTLNVTF